MDLKELGQKYWDEELDGAMMIEGGNWEHDFKEYYNRQDVFEYQGKTYMVCLYRMGPHYDYEVEVIGCDEVEKKQVMIETWVAV